VKRRREAAAVFAYVDNCLAPAERRAFEARMRDDLELTREVAQWEAQNSAIRAAYGAPASARAAVDLGANVNENAPAPTIAAARRAGARAKAAPVPPPARRAAAGRRIVRALAALAALAAGLTIAAPPGGATWPRDPLLEAGLAAYRAFVASSAPIEFAVADPAAAARWLTAQFAGGVAAPPFASNELRLVGARVAPGMATRAAFLVYEDRLGERVGLLIEPVDAPPAPEPVWREVGGATLAAWTGAGFGLVAAGPRREPVAALARFVAAARAPTR
jgi:anti-sigma factor RsiW